MNGIKQTGMYVSRSMLMGIAVAGIAASSSNLLAASATWQGANGGTWSTTTNWSSGVIPATGDTLTFSDSTLTSSTDDSSVQTVSGTNKVTSSSTAATVFNFSGSGHTITAATGANLVLGNVTVSAAGNYTFDWTNYGTVTTSTQQGLLLKSATYNVASGATLTLKGVFAGLTSNSPTITKSGAGTLVLNQSSGAGGTYATLAVSAGNVQLGGAGSDVYTISSIAQTSTVQLQANNGVLPGTANYASGITGMAGTFDLNGFSQTLNKFVGASTAIVTNNGSTTSTLTLGQTARGASSGTAGLGVQTFAGQIQDGSAAVAVVLGTTYAATSNLTSYVLSHANNYSGGTTLSDGTSTASNSLTASTDGALGSGNVTVGAYDTLTLTGGTTNNYIGNSATLTLASNSSVALTFTGTDIISKLVVGTTTYTTGTFGGAGSGAENILSNFSGTGILSVVPEPASLSLLMLGGGLLIRRRRA